MHIRIEELAQHIDRSYFKNEKAAMDFVNEFYDSVRPSLVKEYCNCKSNNILIFPKESNIFRALKECPLSSLRVVVFGQDPYHTPGMANGLAFDVDKSVKKLPPSLRNIIAEMVADTGTNTPYENVNSYFEHLPSQGVLLLNTSLTVVESQPASHASIWKPFTTSLVKYISENKDDVVWIMWGNHAKAFKKHITNPTHSFIEGVHPSPLSGGKYSGGKYFSRANELLKHPVKW